MQNTDKSLVIRKYWKSSLLLDFYNKKSFMEKMYLDCTMSVQKIIRHVCYTIFQFRCARWPSELHRQRPSSFVLLLKRCLWKIYQIWCLHKPFLRDKWEKMRWMRISHFGGWISHFLYYEKWVLKEKRYFMPVT